MKHSQNSGCFWSIGGETVGKLHKRTFWSDDSVLYHDKGLGYTGVSLPHSSHCTLRYVRFAPCKFASKRAVRSESSLDATSITPLIARVNSADLAGYVGVPLLPHRSTCVPPEAVHCLEEDHLPQLRSTIPGSRVCG